MIQTQKNREFQLKRLAESISETLKTSADTSFSIPHIKKLIHSLEQKHQIKRILLIENASERIIIDTHLGNTGKIISQTLNETDLQGYKLVKTFTSPFSTSFFQNNLYAFKSIHRTDVSRDQPSTYTIFLILDEYQTRIIAPNSLLAVTILFSVGILIMLISIYLTQRRLLLAPLDHITRNLTEQNQSEISTIPYKSDDEFGTLVSRYNELIENKLLYNKELETTRRRIYGITNTAPVLLSYIGSDLHFKFVNQLHEDWFGIPIEMFTENTLEDVLGEQSFKQVKPEVDAVLAGKKVSFEAEIPYQFLEDKLVIFNFVPNRLDDGTVDGFFVCIEDLSETRRNESKLADYAQKLEYREFALEEEKLVAEQALKIKSEFLASMSHEIRTPMNGVLGMLSLLMDTNLTEDQMIKASLAKTSAESLLTLINDILDFSKVESGKLEIEKIDFNLINILENTTEGLSKLAEDKSITLLLDTTEVNEAMVKGDPGRLRQVLNNLLSNAIKFTQKGEVILKATLSKESHENLHLICEVSDTGIGIPAGKLESIFDSFTQVDASTTRQYGGTGLGLAIARKLCQLMGGDISATSELGKGSTFTCRINLECSELKPTTETTINLTGKKLLILEPNHSARRICVTQLLKWNASIEESISIDEARTNYRESSIWY